MTYETQFSRAGDVTTISVYAPDFANAKAALHIGMRADEPSIGSFTEFDGYGDSVTNTTPQDATERFLRHLKVDL